jgi:ADP-ribose pyrophosphatase
MDEYKVVQTRVIFDHPGVKIVIDTLEHFGRRRPYFYLASPVEAVATLGITGSGDILLTRQYRHPVGQVILDLPAGRLNPGETPLDGARREFEEETGYKPGWIEKIGYYNQFPGTLRAGTSLFFARRLEKTVQRLDDGEELDVVPVAADRLGAMILNGEILDGSLQLAYLLAQAKGLLNRLV